MLDAVQFDDAYMYGYYQYELPRMNQISMSCIPHSPYNLEPDGFGEVIGVIPCSDGMVYLLKLRDGIEYRLCDGPTAPEYPRTPKGTNGPGPRD